MATYIPVGTAGSPSTDVVTIQGIASMTPVAISASALPLPSGAATEATLATRLSETDFDTKTGSLTETAPATDTASSGLNGRLQRIAQRLTSLIALLPASLGQKTMANSLAVVIASDQSAVAISAASLPLPTGAATETTLAAAAASLNTMDDWDESDRAKVNPIVGQAGIEGGAGVSTAATVRVAIATNANAVSVSSLPLPTGAATETTLSAINGKLVTAKTADYDTGAGTDTVQMMGIALPKAGGAVAGGTSTDPIRVDPTGTTTQPVSASSLPLPSGAATEATLATRLSESDFDTKTGSLTETAPATDTASSGLNGRLQRIAQNITSLIAFFLTDNAGFTDGTSKVLPAGYILDDTAGTALTENDVAAARIDSKRALVMVVEDATNRGRKATVTLAGNQNMDIAAISGTAPTVAGFLNVHGKAAHDAADSTNNPVKVGGHAHTALRTAVADGDIADLYADDLGRVVVVPHQARDLVSSEVLTLTATTTVTALDTAESNIFHDIVALILANTSSTGSEVTLYDNDGTTVRATFYVPGNDVRGVVFSAPLKAAAVNSAWKLKTVTSISSLKATVQYVKNN